MTRPAIPCVAHLCLSVALVLGGCAGGGGDAPALTLPEMPKMPDLSAVSSITAPAEEAPQGSATELYTRIARGAVGCWFATNGPLKKGYIYHAEADAPSRGGKAEITIHVRDMAQPNPRGPKAFKVTIDPKDEASAVLASENLKMPEPMAEAMKADIGRWSHGELGCKGATTATGWAPEDHTASIAPPPAPKGASKKPAKKAAAAKSAPATATKKAPASAPSAP